MNKNLTQKLKFIQYFFIVFLIIFLLIVASRFSDLRQFLKLILTGKYYYILLIFALQATYLWIQALVYDKVLLTFSKQISRLTVLRLFLAANFTNLALPLGGASGIGLFVAYAPHLKLKKSQVILANFFYYFYMFASSTILFISLFFASSVDLVIWQKNILIITASLIILLAVIFFVLVINPYTMRWFIDSSMNFLNRLTYFFRRRTTFGEKHKYVAISDLTALRDIFLKKQFIQPSFYALIGHASHILVLYACFLAFGFNPQLLLVVIGYVISIVFTLISFTPSGVGIVEPIMVYFFSSNGISLELSTLAILLYRGVVFWLPFFLGFFSLRYLNLEKNS